MPLHVDCRPKNFDEVVGNKSTIESLKTILDRDDKPHVYLFSGPTGCGKTTFARIFSNLLGCSKQDLLEYNSANTRGIDTAREIISSMRYKPLSGNIRVYLLDECHKWTKDFMDAMLKPFEDTPQHVYFLLCTTEPDRLLKTIRNRCSQFTVQKLQSNRIVRLLNKICEKENIKIPDDIIKEVAISSEGCPRQALVILDQIRGLDTEDMAEAIRDAGVEQKQIIELCRALLENKSWSVISKIVKGIEDEPEKVRRAVLGYMTSVLLSKDNLQAGIVIEFFEEHFFNSGKAGLTLACYNIVKNLT